MADKRIIELDNVASVTDDDYVMIDNATNGTGKVKATLFGCGKDYSTDEQDTGLKWIDGKHIYKRTFELATGIDINSTGVSLPSAITNRLINVDNFIKAEAVRTTTELTQACIAIWVNSDRKVYTADPWSKVNIFTFYYTKITDTVS